MNKPSRPRYAETPKEGIRLTRSYEDHSGAALTGAVLGLCAGLMLMVAGFVALSLLGGF